MDSGSESEQESACSSSGEDASYNRSQSLGQQKQTPISSQHSAVADYQTMVAAAKMKYLQQQQGDQSRPDDQSQQPQQMMMLSNCLPFMMPGGSSYSMMMQSSQGAMPSFFNQNATSSPSSRESEAATGSPLNLQTTREDRPSSRSRQAPIDYQNQSMAQQQQQPFTHEHQVLPSGRGGSSHQGAQNASQSRNSPQSGLPCSLPNTLSMSGSGSHLGISQDQMGQQQQAQQQSVGNFSLDYSATAAQQQRPEPPKPEHPAPPKRPLTPYMRFSKCMWQQVKSTNPGLSVCEIGATIGRMWRELPNEEKQKHNEDFTLDKVRYDNELKSYLKSTGLHASDLVKTKKKKVPTATLR